MVNITNNQGNENQTVVRCHFIPIRMAKKQTKPSEISAAGRMWRKWSSADMNVKTVQVLWKTVQKFLTKLKQNHHYDPPIPH